MTNEELEAILTNPTPQEYLRLGRRAHLKSSVDLVQKPVGNPKGISLARYPRFAELPPRGQGRLELLYVYSGSCSVAVNGESLRLTRGHVLLVEPDAVWGYGTLGQEDIVLSLCMTRNYVRELMLMGAFTGAELLRNMLLSGAEQRRMEDFFYFPLQQGEPPELLILAVCRELLDPDPITEETVYHMMALLQCELSRVYRPAGRMEGRGETDGRILMILGYIARNYTGVSLRATAEHFHLNPNYLSNILKEKTGKTFRELVIDQRMRAAQRLLAGTELPIAEVARQVGYDNTTFFYQKFRDFTGCSPTEYRQR